MKSSSGDTDTDGNRFATMINNNGLNIRRDRYRDREEKKMKQGCLEKEGGQRKDVHVPQIINIDDYYHEQHCIRVGWVESTTSFVT